MAPPPVPVVLVGAHGHGRWHLQNVDRLVRAGAPLRLVGICDPRPLSPEERALAGDVPVLGRLDDLLTAVRPEITIVCTPIHTHAGLALTAAAAGSHVLLEKPPTPTLAGFDALRHGLASAGAACQVGFQSLGAHSAPPRPGAGGRRRDRPGHRHRRGRAWRRDASYYARAPWAGRRVIDGEPVVDGALTNPFAHATATALALDGEPGDVRDVRVELFRANPIEADDTSCLRLVTARGTAVTVAATLCADREVEPYVAVHGTRGPRRAPVPHRARPVGAARAAGRGHRAREHRPAGKPSSTTCAHPTCRWSRRSRPRAASCRWWRRFGSPLSRSRCRPSSTASGPAPRRVVPGIAAAVVRSADRLALLSELDLPWARPRVSATGG
jgi:predicted dehydrogenase